MPAWLRRFVRRFGAKTYRKPGDRSHGNALLWGQNKLNALAASGRKSSSSAGRTKRHRRGTNLDESGSGSSCKRQTLNYDFDETDDKSLQLKSKWRKVRQTKTTNSGENCNAETDIGRGDRLSTDKFDAFISLVRQMSKAAVVKATVESETDVRDQRRTNATGSAIVSFDSLRPPSITADSIFRVTDERTRAKHDTSLNQHQQPINNHVNEGIAFTGSVPRHRCRNKVDTATMSATGTKQPLQSSTTGAGQVRQRAVGGAVNAAASVAIYRRLALMEETLRHLASIMSRVETDNTDNEVTAEWRNLAAIADRWLFWGFMTVTVVYTGVTMVLVPFYLQ